MTWGQIFLFIAAIIFFALAVGLLAVVAKGIDWHFLGLLFICLGLIFGGTALPVKLRIGKEG